MEKSVVQLYTFVVHCARPFVDDASLITTVPLKTGGNTGWFAEWGGTGSRTRANFVEKGRRKPVSYLGGSMK